MTEPDCGRLVEPSLTEAHYETKRSPKVYVGDA